MGIEGPCFHCGIEHTPLWRHGPLEKPVLCNACGSRWRLRGTLDDYIPKHGFTETSKPVEVQNCSSCYEDNTNNGSRSGSQGSSCSSCTQMESPLGVSESLSCYKYAVKNATTSQPSVAQ